MKPSRIFISILLLASIAVLAVPSANNTQPMTAKAYFSPNGGCTEAIVNELKRAKTEVLVQAYVFTSKDIASALISAHKRKVKVQVILDKSNLTGNYSAADFIAHAGIPTLIDSEHAIAHNKVMVIDNQTVVTGSFNFTKAAEISNAENVLVVSDQKLANDYANNWHEHAKHSTIYEGR